MQESGPASRVEYSPDGGVAIHFASNGGTYRLSADLPPLDAPGARFAYHVRRRDDGRVTDEVGAVGLGVLHRSRDLGETWATSPVRGFEDISFLHAFPTASGGYIFQEPGWDPRTRGTVGNAGRLVVTDADLVPQAEVRNGFGHWHSPRAIGEARGVLMYADYQKNPGLRSGQVRLPSHVFRSRDGGLTWDVVFATDVVRHFHLLVPDPAVPGRWWLTSGDQPHECRVWRTDDDGDTWTDLSETLMAAFARINITNQAVLRTTDIAFTERGMLWGTDDSLWSGVHPRGSRVVEIGTRAIPASARRVGIFGPELRNLLAYEGTILVFAGNAPEVQGFDMPTVWCADPTRREGSKLILRLPRTKNRRSGFTYSRLSAEHADGVFFSMRGRDDLFDRSAPLVLRWRITRES